MSIKVSVKAMSPSDLKGALSEGQHIPDAVIGVVNQLLISSGSTSPTLTLKEVTRAIAEHVGSNNFPREWLDFEPVFRASGWHVTYDQPGYNESYEPTYKFTPRN